jgi:uncharacterized protein YgiM (DUF1202 family)
MLALFILTLLSLACSLSLTEPTANLSESVSTETAIPYPIPIPTAPKPTGTPAPITCTVTAAESLHLRETPDIKGTVITWLKPGNQLFILTDPPAVGVWVKVTTADNLTGWVNSNFCEVTQ